MVEFVKSGSIGGRLELLVRRDNTEERVRFYSDEAREVYIRLVSLESQLEELRTLRGAFRNLWRVILAWWHGKA